MDASTIGIDQIPALMPAFGPTRDCVDASPGSAYSAPVPIGWFQGEDVANGQANASLLDGLPVASRVTPGPRGAKHAEATSAIATASTPSPPDTSTPPRKRPMVIQSPSSIPVDSTRGARLPT